MNNYRYRANAANASLPMGVYVSADEYNRTRFLLELNEKSVKILENYLQISFALPKLDQLVVVKQKLQPEGRSVLDSSFRIQTITDSFASSTQP